MEFSKLILEAREKTGLSRTAFHHTARFRFSCQTYKRMEDREIGQIEHAIDVLKSLNIDLKKGILAWLRDQLPSEDLKSFFSMRFQISKEYRWKRSALKNPLSFTKAKLDYSQKVKFTGKSLIV